MGSRLHILVFIRAEKKQNVIDCWDWQRIGCVFYLVSDSVDWGVAGAFAELADEVDGSPLSSSIIIGIVCFHSLLRRIIQVHLQMDSLIIDLRIK